MADKTIQTYFRAGLPGSEITLSGQGSGLTPPTLPITSETRVIPSQSPWVERESSGVSDYTYDFTVDQKASTFVIKTWVGKLINWELGTNTDATGDHSTAPTSGNREYGQAYVASVTPEEDGTSIRLGVSCEGHGERKTGGTWGTY